ncbi:MAG: NADH-quinone oxidoreductase subunit J [Bryobacterales bacterium]|nr:NADH-quinone oxidoreductase subunit J [Bryobacterales bacterium]
MLDTFFFYIFALLTLGGAIATITRRSAVHSALSLVVSLLGVAGLYLLQQAEFLFAVQIVLYIGGIMVLFLFVIMLVNLDEAGKQRQFNRQWLLGLLACLLVGAQMIWMLRGSGALRLPEAPAALSAAASGAISSAAGEGNVEQLADLLFRQYLLPFEVVSLLLLVAIVGSVMLAKKSS